MADDSITQTPSQAPKPGCPACAGRVATSPGARCDRCQAPLPSALASGPAIPSLRLPETEMQESGFFVLGVLVLGFSLFLALIAPGLLILLAALSVPACVRACRMTTLRGESATIRLQHLFVASFLSSLGVAMVTGMAGVVAGSLLCTGMLAAAGGGSPNLETLLWISTIVAVGVMGSLFVVLWPRRVRHFDPRPKWERDED